MKPKSIVGRFLLRGFTLIELLVAMAVMALVLVLVSQIVGSALSWASSSRTLMSSGEQARSIWQRLTSDLNSRVNLSTENFRVIKQAGDNDQVDFLTDVRNTTASSRFSKVSWQVETANDPLTGRAEPMLFRVLAAVDWSDDPAASLADGQTPLVGDLYAEGVFRLEVAFQNRDGTLTADPPADLGNVGALIIGIAILDASARGRLSDAELAGLAAALPDVTDGQTPLGTWSTTAFNHKTASQVRFYQKTFVMNPRPATSR